MACSSDWLGIVGRVLIVGVAYLAATMAPLAIPSFRQFDKPKRPPWLGASG